MERETIVLSLDLKNKGMMKYIKSLINEIREEFNDASLIKMWGIR